MSEITSLQNPRVKDAVRLRDGRHRQRRGRFLIDGIRELGRAIDGQIELLEVFICYEKCTRQQVRILSGMLGDFDYADVLYVSPAVFEKLAFGDRSEGVVAVAEMPETGLDGVNLTDNPLVVVLEGVEKPGNVGAVLRSADGAGADLIIVADGRTDLYNPNAIRASLGTIFTRQVAAATTAATLDWLRQAGLAIFAARVDGSVPYTEVDYRGPSAIVLGSEAKGLSSAWSADDVTPISLPCSARPTA